MIREMGNYYSYDILIEHWYEMTVWTIQYGRYHDFSISNIDWNDIFYSNGAYQVVFESKQVKNDFSYENFIF